MAQKMLKFFIVIIALLGSTMMIDARRTTPTPSSPSTRTVTRTVTQPATRVVSRQTVVRQQPAPVVVRPPPVVVRQQPVVVRQQPNVVVVPSQQPRVVVQQHPSVVQQPLVVPTQRVVVPNQSVVVAQPQIPFTRPTSCALKPSAIVNKYRSSDEQRYSWNCLTNRATPLGYMPRTCIVNGVRSNRLVYTYNSLAAPAMRYTSYDCRTQIGPLPASSGSMGLIVGVIIGICICLCIVGAVFGNKGGDGETYEEELIVQDEVVYEQPETVVVYEQPQVIYEQPQVIYEQQPMYDHYQQPVTYVQEAGVDMYTGQQVVEEVEM